MSEGKWVVSYNTRAGEYSNPEFVLNEDIEPGSFGDHGHTSYVTFDTKAEAEKWIKPLREKVLEQKRLDSDEFRKRLWR